MNVNVRMASRGSSVKKILMSVNAMHHVCMACAQTGERTTTVIVNQNMVARTALWS
jgi:hypothetical protein